MWYPDTYIHAIIQNIRKDITALIWGLSTCFSTSQRFRIQGCGAGSSNGNQRNWEEARDQSRFGWAFGRIGSVTGGRDDGTDSCGGQ